MKSPNELGPADNDAPVDWTRKRIVFLSVSGILLLLLLWWAQSVLLPFMLALLIAYVFTPLVQLCERRLPRSASILLVYVVTFAVIYGSVAAMAPRIYVESLKLARDTPAMARGLTHTWGLRLEGWV